MAIKYHLEDLRPLEPTIIEQKLRNGVNYSRILLYLNAKKNSPALPAAVPEISNYLCLDRSVVFKVLMFFTNVGIVKRIRRSPKEVVFIPLSEIKPYVETAYKRVFGKEPEGKP